MVVTTAMRKLERSLRSATGQRPAWMGCGRAAPRMQAQAAALLVSLFVRGCSGDEPYVGEHRAGLGKFLAALRESLEGKGQPLVKMPVIGGKELDVAGIGIGAMYGWGGGLKPAWS